jgi:MerR family transcriptional regulator, mercuric resistance operon regulatory protein
MVKHVSGRGLQRAELARCTGCHPETIRYYEKIGMLPDPPRTASGYRVYDETHIRRLRFILRARELGFRWKKSADCWPSSMKACRPVPR